MLSAYLTARSSMLHVQSDNRPRPFDRVSLQFTLKPRFTRTSIHDHTTSPRTSAQSRDVLPCKSISSQFMPNCPFRGNSSELQLRRHRAAKSKELCLSAAYRQDISACAKAVRHVRNLWQSHRLFRLIPPTDETVHTEAVLSPSILRKSPSEESPGPEAYAAYATCILPKLT